MWFLHMGLIYSIICQESNMLLVQFIILLQFKVIFVLSTFWSFPVSWPTRLSSYTPLIHPCRLRIFHLAIALLKDLFWLPCKFCISREFHDIFYPIEEFWYRQAWIIILSEFIFCLIFDWFWWSWHTGPWDILSLRDLRRPQIFSCSYYSPQ